MQYRALLGLTCAAVLLAACEEGVYDGFDRRPDSGSANSSSPTPDNRGVIVYDTYQVIEARNGDTMESVAARIGMTGKDLADYNGLSASHTPRSKEVFAIPPGVVVGADGEIKTTELDNGSGQAEPFGQATGGANAIRHTVESGETAYTIARLYNVSVTSLASWNDLDRDLTVRVGQQLLIPQSVQATTQPAPAPAPKETETEAETASTEAATAPQPAPAPAPQQAKMTTPLEGKIIRGYSNKPGGNEGLDIQADAGSPVVAADAGEVALISESVGDTTIVLLRHQENLYTVYSNVTGVTLKKGDKVRRGQTIASVAPGNPPYLHFEVRKGTQSQDPASYLN
ncbi:MAG: peptidoglycan DD-metalloendopeptidase family protein [Pseudomonadota bacterium]